MVDKAELLAAFERLLEATPELPAETVGLVQVFTELAALKTEVRATGRQTKGTLDTLRQALAALEKETACHERALAQARQQTLKPVLLELLDLRDRFAAGIEAAERWRPGWFKRLLLGKELRRLTAILAGQRLTLERFEQWLAGLGVQPIEVLEQAFDPRSMRAAEVVCRVDLPAGTVVAELRRGYRWHGEVLRPAEVAVNRVSE